MLPLDGVVKNPYSAFPELLALSACFPHAQRRDSGPLDSEPLLLLLEENIFRPLCVLHPLPVKTSPFTSDFRAMNVIGPPQAVQ